MIIKKCNRCKKSKDIMSFLKKKNNSEELKYNKLCDKCIFKTKKIILPGLCGSCGKNCPKIGNSTCEKCISKASSSQRNKRERAKKNGLCRKCATNKPMENYTMCAICHINNKLPLRTKLFKNAKNRAKKSGIDFSIIETDIIIPTHCPIFGFLLQENDFMAKSNSYSIDRIDNSKGYIKGNVHIISHRANAIKNDASIDELELILKYLKLLQQRIKS